MLYDQLRWWKNQAKVNEMVFRAECIIDNLLDLKEVEISTDISASEYNHKKKLYEGIIESYYRQCRTDREREALKKIVDIVREQRETLINIIEDCR